MRRDLPPVVDYTDKDYASLRRALLDLAAYRLPEWTDRSPGDVGMLLVDLFAYVGDVVSYYQDRIANELFLTTAGERRNVLQLLRLIGYELAPPVAAGVELTLTFAPPRPGEDPVVVVPHGARFATKAQVRGAAGPVPALPFTYLGPDLRVDRNLLGPDLRRPGLPVRQCEPPVTELLGVSTGEPDQAFPLGAVPVVPETVAVTVTDGAGARTWDRRDHLLYTVTEDLEAEPSRPDTTAFMLRFDEHARAEVVFGDGLYGAVPARGARIEATCCAGGGAAGNVPPGTVVDVRPPVTGVVGAVNERAATGGADAETVEHAVRFGPLAFRSGDRAVTLQDFVALAMRAGGVAKVRARTTGWNRVDLFVAAAGEQLAPADSETKRRIVAFFEHRRMVGVSVRVHDPTPVAVDVHVDVVAEYHHVPEDVRAAAERAVRGLLAFSAVDFGAPVYLSKVYEAVEAVPGIRSAHVTRFRRADAGTTSDVLRRRLGAARLGDVQVLLERALSGDIPAGGRIAVGEFEIAVPGEVRVVLQEEAL